MNRNNGRQIGARLVILRDYLFANADKTHAVSLEDIQKEYFNAHIEGQNGDYVSIKTVYRDLEALEDNWGIQTKYVEKYKGYVLLDPPFEANELRLIVDSIQASKFITQRKADVLTRKIIKQFGNERQKLNRPAFVHQRIRNQSDDVVEDVAVFYDAIAADRKVSFRYFHMRPGQRKEYSNSGNPIIVSPFALYWQDGNLYLYAYDGRTFRHYRVDRMDRISKKPLVLEREGGDLYDAKALTSQKVKVFKMYSGPEHKVKMRFQNTLADQVIDEFGRDIVMIPDGSEHFTITTAVEVSPPFYAWVSTFGRRAKIISPPEAVEGMKDFLQKAAEMYKDDGNT